MQMARLAGGNLVELGRAVTLADVVALHPGRPERCLCRGSGQIVVHGKVGAQTTICGVTLAAFNRECGPRVVTLDRGEAFWIRGGSPEEWGLAQIFAAEMRDFEWREEFRQRLRTVGGRDAR